MEAPFLFIIAHIFVILVWLFSESQDLPPCFLSVYKNHQWCNAPTVRDEPKLGDDCGVRKKKNGKWIRDGRITQIDQDDHKLKVCWDRSPEFEEDH